MFSFGSQIAQFSNIGLESESQASLLINTTTLYSTVDVFLIVSEPAETGSFVVNNESPNQQSVVALVVTDGEKDDYTGNRSFGQFTLAGEKFRPSVFHEGTTLIINSSGGGILLQRNELTPNELYIEGTVHWMEGEFVVEENALIHLTKSTQLQFDELPVSLVPEEAQNYEPPTGPLRPYDPYDPPYPGDEGDGRNKQTEYRISGSGTFIIETSSISQNLQRNLSILGTLVKIKSSEAVRLEQCSGKVFNMYENTTFHVESGFHTNCGINIDKSTLKLHSEDSQTLEMRVSQTTFKANSLNFEIRDSVSLFNQTNSHYNQSVISIQGDAGNMVNLNSQLNLENESTMQCGESAALFFHENSEFIQRDSSLVLLNASRIELYANSVYNISGGVEMFHHSSISLSLHSTLNLLNGNMNLFDNSSISLSSNSRIEAVAVSINPPLFFYNFPPIVLIIL